MPRLENPFNGMIDKKNSGHPFLHPFAPAEEIPDTKSLSPEDAAYLAELEALVGEDELLTDEQKADYDRLKGEPASYEKKD